MDKPYHTIDGKDVSLEKLCELEPIWASNRIKKLEMKLKKETRRANHNRETRGDVADLAEQQFEKDKKRIKELEAEVELYKA